MTGPARTTLCDELDGPPATTRSLVEALAGRLATLRVISGADAIGSMTAGYAELGRRVARTAEGARLRQALESTRVAANGEDLWRALGIDALAARSAATPVLDDLRGDIALLAADDLDDALDDRGRVPSPPRVDEPDRPVDFLDYLVGMWAFATEAARAIENLAAVGGAAAVVRPPPTLPAPVQGELLR